MINRPGDNEVRGAVCVWVVGSTDNDSNSDNDNEKDKDNDVAWWWDEMVMGW